jgi:signal transduction histidine kinase
MQVSTLNIVQVVVVITTILLAVAVFILLYVRLYNQRSKKHLEEKTEMVTEFEKQLRASQVEVQENTYSTLAKELHDNVGQLLSSAKMLLGLTERTLGTPPDTLLTANETIGQAIKELRSLSKALDKEWLEQFNFIDNLATEIARINAGEIVSASLTHTHDIQLRSGEQIMLFRVVQEAIQNAIKHAHPKHIDILLAADEQKLSISIADDGSGFDSPALNSGMGIGNMIHRVNLLGGTINWQSKPGHGTTVNISLPLNHVNL